ncbi:hypothetical protein M388_02800 [Mesotoga sp. Brook.08.YT.4.2.5.4.]|nr:MULTISPECIES: hypothetical protein [unclassified Mesotoga]RAO96363.1 hypothetical protein M388_02800 [Mesotoga sp. Brook.08.YT.4.2.5.4.]
MKLRGKRVVVLVEDGFEDLEFWVPSDFKRRAQKLLSPEKRRIGCTRARVGLPQYQMRTSNR